MINFCCIPLRIFPPRENIILAPELIGAGMYGEVYKINDSWCLKTPKPGAQNNFASEAIFFSQYYGRGSVHFTQSQTGGVLSMRLQPGIPLSKIAEPEKEISTEKVTAMLESLRDSNILHGDLKPENVL